MVTSSAAGFRPLWWVIWCPEEEEEEEEEEDAYREWWNGTQQEGKGWISGDFIIASRSLISRVRHR